MNGEGVGRLDGKIILVPKALLGEIVEIVIVKDYGNYAVAKLLEIKKKSSSRRASPCAYANCGGCELMHMDYSMQLRFKHDLVQKTIKKIANISCEVADTIASDREFNFRNKVSFSCLNNNFGMREASSHNVVDIDKCLLASSRQNEIFSLFKQYCRDNHLLGYDMATNNGVIKNLVIKDFANGILVAVVTANKVDLSNLYTILSSRFDRIGLFEVINKRRDSVVLAGQCIHVGGLKEVELCEFGLKYPIDIFGFHQTNDYIQNEIYLKMMEYIKEDSIVVNGYSGAGVLSAIMAKRAKAVIGIELERSSHNSAERLKQVNNITNLTNICGDFTKEYNKIKNTIPSHTLVLDPSKKGCGEIIRQINNANSIIYLSCNPIALAKDLRELNKNYIIEEVTPFDMFPNTISVETLVKLKRREL